MHAWAFILAGFAGALTWQMYVYFARYIAALQSLPALVLFIAAGFGIIFGLMWLLEDGGSTGSIQFDIRPRTTCIAAVMAAAIYILSSISYTQLNTPFSARGATWKFTQCARLSTSAAWLLFMRVNHAAAPVDDTARGGCLAEHAAHPV